MRDSHGSVQFAVHGHGLGKLLVCAGVLCMAATGCGTVELLTGESARKQAQAEESKQRLQATQQNVMRFADHYVQEISTDIALLSRKVASGEERIRLLDWQFSNATAAIQVAAAPNPIANAVDMIVMVNLSRRIVENLWIQRYGDDAQPVLESYVSIERESWRLLEGIANEQRIAELRTYIEEWYGENTSLESAAFVRFTGLAAVGMKTSRRTAPSLLGIVGLDPMADIDPAVREVEQTRLLAERTVYYAQRLPLLLDIQADLLAAKFDEAPDTQRVLATTDQLGRASASIAGLLDQTPALVSREREAAIAQFMGELRRQQADMLALATQLRAALEAGGMTAEALDTLVNSTDQLIARFKPDTAAPVQAGPGRPFDINEYTRMIVELSATAQEFQALLEGVGRLEPRLAGRVEVLSQRVESLVDQLFLRLLLIVVAVLLAAVAYRAIARRMDRSHGGS